MTYYVKKPVYGCVRPNILAGRLQIVTSVHVCFFWLTTRETWAHTIDSKLYSTLAFCSPEVINSFSLNQVGSSRAGYSLVLAVLQWRNVTRARGPDVDQGAALVALNNKARGLTNLCSDAGVFGVRTFQPTEIHVVLDLETIIRCIDHYHIRTERKSATKPAKRVIV